ncbi:hypothetical protein [Rickettsiales endosymbiont of Stachyamoeba lipophora]|nr:hypothetical protein [Rickettsiales endosymbiont of Stachyamoeba lipophora]
MDIELPTVASVQDRLTAISKVIQAVANEEITPQEGLNLVGLLRDLPKP